MVFASPILTATSSGLKGSLRWMPPALLAGGKLTRQSDMVIWDDRLRKSWSFLQRLFP